VAGAVVEASGAVAAGCIEAAAVLVLSAGREAEARFGGPWVVVPLWARLAAPRCVDRGAGVLQ